MKNKIIQSLRKIEKDFGVKILLACETGSRAWGFASPDSDYDIRFIYMHHKDWYLSLSEKKDSIEMILDNGELDITGWDLRKTLQLLKKSNISVFERIQSPVVYISNELFINGLNQIQDSFFAPIAGMHHYLSMAKNFNDKCQNVDSVKLKNYFYALRAVLCCLWIKQEKTMPPIEFKKMLFLLNKEQKSLVDELLKLKQIMDEKYLHPIEPIINSFLQVSINECDAIAGSLPSSRYSADLLDDFFINILNS